jgi:hypothetical protein
MRQLQLLTFPLSVFEQYTCPTCHTLFSVGQDSRKIFVLVEVSSSDGNFNTFGYFFGGQCCEVQSLNINFVTSKTLILHAWSRGHLTKIWSKKYIHG